MNRKINLILIIVIIVACGVAIYFYQKTSNLKENLNVAPLNVGDTSTTTKPAIKTSTSTRQNEIQNKKN